MKIASSKNKGREGEKEIISLYEYNFSDLVDHFRRAAGQGEDLKLSPIALKQLPLDNEVKRRKRLGIMRWFEQVMKRLKPGLEPVIWSREDHSKIWLVTVRSTFFFELLKLWRINNVRGNN